MEYGFVKVAAATPEIRVADCAFNTETVLELWQQADGKAASWLVFPELVLTGYTCSDLFLQPVLLDGCLAGLKKLLEASRQLQSVAVVGAPLIHQGKLFNCAVVLQNGEVLGIVPKTALPTYGEFYEQRHFKAAPPSTMVYTDALTAIGLEDAAPFGTQQLFSCQEQPSFTFAVEICEDLWSPLPPSTQHAMAGATVLVNLSASNELIGKADYRRQLVTGQSARLLCGYVYANAGYGESTTDVVFSGHNIIAENGVILAESQLFDTGLTISEIDVQKMAQERRKLNTFPLREYAGYYHSSFTASKLAADLTRTIDALPFVPADKAHRAERCELILSIQAQGLKKRLVHSWSKTAVIGISGGLDSTLALLVAAAPWIC